VALMVENFLAHGKSIVSVAIKLAIGRSAARTICYCWCCHCWHCWHDAASLVHCQNGSEPKFAQSIASPSPPLLPTSTILSASFIIPCSFFLEFKNLKFLSFASFTHFVVLNNLAYVLA
jgi:hypothetical protein